MTRTTTISPRGVAIAGIVRRFSPDEPAQLMQLGPNLQTVEPASAPELEAIAYYRDLAIKKRGGTPPRPDEEFVGGLTYAQYFALSGRDEEHFWQIFETGKMSIMDFQERDVKPN
ncbi:MAG: hypothetical protein HY327_14300 [Chloroflexi bacterium]|nr:hypothetical protein [Chloroflexota bacterium]